MDAIKENFNVVSKYASFSERKRVIIDRALKLIVLLAVIYGLCKTHLNDDKVVVKSLNDENQRLLLVISDMSKTANFEKKRFDDLSDKFINYVVKSSKDKDSLRNDLNDFIKKAKE